MTDRARSFWSWPRGERRDLRRFGVIMAVAWGAVSLVMWRQGGEVVPAAVGALSVLFLLTGLLAPAGLAIPFGLWMCLARVLGWVNLHLLLGLIFYGLFTFIGLCMRIVGRDPLQRRWEAGRSSYWQQRSLPGNTRHHFERQF